MSKETEAATALLLQGASDEQIGAAGQGGSDLDAAALKAVHDIEDIFAEGWKGGVLQRRAALQIVIKEVIAPGGALAPETVRVQELLEANNRYLQRARDAEKLVAGLQADIDERDTVLRQANDALAKAIRQLDGIAAMGCVIIGDPTDLVMRIKNPKWIRHRNRGSRYVVIGDAEMQISRNWSGEVARRRLISEGDSLTIYRDGADGKLWVRFPDEVNDSRFEPVE